jgi:hypothetical protein
VRLAVEPGEHVKSAQAPTPSYGKCVESRDLYRLYFHGPAYQVVESSCRAGEKVIGLFAANLPANHVPEERPTLVSPRLIELCFQTAGIWEVAAKSRMGLPYHVGRVCIFDSPERAHGRLRSVVSQRAEGGFDASVVDEKGHVYISVQGYRTMALPEAVAPGLLKPLQAAIG